MCRTAKPYAGLLSTVEVSCIHLANHGPFDVAQGSYDVVA